MNLTSTVSWKDGMAFEAELDGFRFDIDADDAHGGRQFGPRPKGLLLTALIGCTAMDVVAILGKMRVPLADLRVSAEGELSAEHPKRYERVVVRYEFEGDDLPVHKLRRAVSLSEERYCGIRATLAPVVDITNEIRLNGEPLRHAPADAETAAPA